MSPVRANPCAGRGACAATAALLPAVAAPVARPVLMPLWMLVAAVIALLITPWNLYNNPIIVNIFLAALGAVLGPLFGIIIADYYLLRKQKVQVSELFKANGMHSFKNGWNMRAVTTFVVTSIPSIIVAVVPLSWCKFLSPFSWFIGAALSLVVHYYVSRNDPYVVRAVEAASKVDLDADLAAVAR